MEQVKKCVDAGAEIVRITVQGKREAAACMDIREALFKDKCAAALCAHAKPSDIVCEHDALEGFYTVHYGSMPDAWQLTCRRQRIGICTETASSVVMLRLATCSVSCVDRLTANLFTCSACNVAAFSLLLWQGLRVCCLHNSIACYLAALPERACREPLLTCAGCWRSYDVPLVADIHFQPTVAMMVAEAFEKIRINPGNFADGRKSFEVINYDDPRPVPRRAGAHPRGALQLPLDPC